MNDLMDNEICETIERNMCKPKKWKTSATGTEFGEWYGMARYGLNSAVGMDFG